MTLYYKILVLALSLPIFAARVVKIDTEQKRMAVTHDGKVKWSPGDYLCVIQGKEKVACGIVTKGLMKGAIVDLTFRQEDTSVEPGDEVRRSTPPSEQKYLGKREEEKAPTASSFPKVGPVFNAMFDWLLTYRPGLAVPLTFDTYHNLALLAIRPNDNLEFSFEVSPAPRVFEANLKIIKNFHFRFGRIWIPFDDLYPHTVFGGRANLAKLLPPGGTAFLPDIWADLGVGLRCSLVATRSQELSTHLYIVNGFQQGGNDPLNPSVRYPEFGAIPYSDNNDNKAVGARIHWGVHQLGGVGLSAYRARFTDQIESPGHVLVLGFDVQVYLGDLEIRGGYAFMEVDLPEPAASDEKNFVRGGYYAETGRRFGKWKVVLRGGQSQHDSRIPTSVTDLGIMGAGVFYQPGPVQISLEHSQDILKRIPNPKTNYSYSAVRVAMMF